jgi:hypothetical protein
MRWRLKGGEDFGVHFDEGTAVAKKIFKERIKCCRRCYIFRNKDRCFWV